MRFVPKQKSIGLLKVGLFISVFSLSLSVTPSVASQPTSNDWVQIHPAGTFPIGCLAMDPANPNTFYIGGICHELFKTTDDGQSWSPIHQGAPLQAGGSCPISCSLGIDPTKTSTLYWGWGSPGNPSAGGLSKSIDGGNTWTALDHGLPCLPVFSIAVDPQNPATLYIGTSCGVFKSRDGGSRWLSFNTGITGTIEALAVDPKNSDRVYGATIEGIFQSLDGGKTWMAFHSGWNFESVKALAIDPQNSSVLYAGTSEGVFRSLDGAKTWMEMNRGLTGRKVAALAIDPLDPGSLYAWTDGGVFKMQIGYWATLQGGGGISPNPPGVVDNDPVTLRAAANPLMDPIPPANSQTRPATQEPVPQSISHPRMTQPSAAGQTTIMADTYPGEFLRCSFDGDLNCLLLPAGTALSPSSDQTHFDLREGRKGQALYTGNVIYDFWLTATQNGDENVDWSDNRGSINPVIKPKTAPWHYSDTRGLVVISDAYTLGPGGASLARGSDNQSYDRTILMFPGTPSGQTDGYVQGRFRVKMPSVPSDEANRVYRFEAKVGYCWWYHAGPWSAGILLGKVTESGIEWLKREDLSYAQGIIQFTYEFPNNVENYSGQEITFVIRVEADTDRTNDRLLIIDPTIRSYERDAQGSLRAKKYPALSYPRPPEFDSNVGNGGSLSLWVKPLLDLGPGDSQVIFHMIRLNNGVPDPTNRLALFIRDGNTLEFGGWCPGDNRGCQQITLARLNEDITIEQSPTGVPHYAWKKGQWHHLAIVWSNQYGMSLYLDGGLVGRNKEYQKHFINLPDRFYLGSHYSGLHPFQGLIDEVRFFNRPLTDHDVQQLFKNDYRSAEGKGTVSLSKEGFGGKTGIDVEAGSTGKVTLTYEVPQDGSIAAGGGIKVIRKHGGGNWQWSPAQTADSNQPGYATFELHPTGSNKTQPEGSLKCYVNDLRLGSANDCYFTLTNGVLLPGDKVVFNFERLRAPGTAAKVPNTQFTVAVDRGGSPGGFFYELPEASHPKLRVVSSSVKRLAVIAPSTAIRGEDFSFVVIAQDEYRNPVADYRGTVSVYWNNTTTPASHHLFSEADQGHYRFSLSSLPAAGFHFLRVSDGTHTAYSNIIEVLDQPPGYRLFWGDLHAHTKFSDGFIGIEDVYCFMRDVANLDFGAVADHIGSPGDFYSSLDFENFPNLSDWEKMIQTSDIITNDPDRISCLRKDGKAFVAFPGYEYSQGRSSQVPACVKRHYPDTSSRQYGAYWSPRWCMRWHENRAYPDLPMWPTSQNRGSWSCIDYPETVNVSCPEFDGDWNVYFVGKVDAATTMWVPNSIDELFQKARDWEAENPGQVLIIPHHGGRQANLDKISAADVPSLIPLVEIISEHINAPCSFESWALKPIHNGAKVGFMASSDNHAGNAGGIPGGFIGVWAKSLSREDIFEAIKARRTIAASRPDRPYLKARLTVGDRWAFMGEELKVLSGSPGTLQIQVGSIGGVKNVQVIQNGRILQETGERSESYFTLEYPLTFSTGSHSIYVKVIQKPEVIDPISYTLPGNPPVDFDLRAEGVAWTSPIFVTATDDPIANAITARAGSNGSISPQGTFTVP
jgi:photosystem II stability/assembly factor-like uncharacterized protein